MAALFERAREWDQSRCPSTDKWEMECFSDVKKIKTAVTFYVTLVKTSIIKEKKVNDAENGYKKKTGIHCCGEYKLLGSMCISLEVPQNAENES